MKVTINTKRMKRIKWIQLRNWGKYFPPQKLTHLYNQVEDVYLGGKWLVPKNNVSQFDSWP